MSETEDRARQVLGKTAENFMRENPIPGDVVGFVSRVSDARELVIEPIKAEDFYHSAADSNEVED